MTESAAIYVNWEVVRSIGRGGAGRVYLVRDASGAPNTRAGLKNLRHAMASSVGVSEDSQYERFGLQFADEGARAERTDECREFVTYSRSLTAQKGYRGWQ